MSTPETAKHKLPDNWVRKSKYHMENIKTGSTVTWSDLRDNFLLFYNNKPMRAFPTLKEGIEYESRLTTRK